LLRCAVTSTQRTSNPTAAAGAGMTRKPPGDGRQVETEHLLYGFTTLRDGTSVALEKNKVSTSAAQTALREMHGGDGGGGGGLSGMFGKQAKAANTAELLPFAPAVDAAFQAANKAAKNDEEDGKVNSRVLLLALLQDEDSGALRMLATMGVDPVQLETDLSPRAQVYIHPSRSPRSRESSRWRRLRRCLHSLHPE